MNMPRIEHTAPAALRKKKKRGNLLKRIFSPVTDTLEEVNTDFADRSHIKKTLIAILKLKGLIIALLTVVIILAACYFVYQSDSTPVVEMSLNYEQSANGLNPNSTRFNAYSVVSQEVVEGMLRYSGIDPESVDINDIIDCISIRPTNTKAFSEEDHFISTSYKISMKTPSGIKGVKTKDLLNFLCKSYKDYLYSGYTENRSILDFDIDKFNDNDFLEIADLLDLKAQQIEKYLNTRVKQSKTFTEQESDETFKSLMQKAEDLRAYDIAKYRSFVIESGCSNDKDRYVKALAYTNRIKRLDYDKDMAAYNVYNDGIRMYDEAMISVVMIPSIDQSKNTYYMSKTKTGMDYMASQADNYLQTAQETAKEIEINQDTINKLSAGTGSQALLQKASNMISEIRRKFSDLSRQIETVDTAYMKYKTKDYLTFAPSNPSLAQRLNVSTLAVLAVAMMAGIFTAIWLTFRNFGGGNNA